MCASTELSQNYDRLLGTHFYEDEIQYDCAGHYFLIRFVAIGAVHQVY